MKSLTTEERHEGICVWGAVGGNKTVLLFYVLAMVVVTQLHTFVKTHRLIHQKG